MDTLRYTLNLLRHNVNTRNAAAAAIIAYAAAKLSSSSRSCLAKDWTVTAGLIPCATATAIAVASIGLKVASRLINNRTVSRSGCREHTPAQLGNHRQQVRVFAFIGKFTKDNLAMARHHNVKLITYSDSVSLTPTALHLCVYLDEDAPDKIRKHAISYTEFVSADSVIVLPSAPFNSRFWKSMTEPFNHLDLDNTSQPITDVGAPVTMLSAVKNPTPNELLGLIELTGTPIVHKPIYAPNLVGNCGGVDYNLHLYKDTREPRIALIKPKDAAVVVDYIKPHTTQSVPCHRNTVFANHLLIVKSYLDKVLWLHPLAKAMQALGDIIIDHHLPHKTLYLRTHRVGEGIFAYDISDEDLGPSDLTFPREPTRDHYQLWNESDRGHTYHAVPRDIIERASIDISNTNHAPAALRTVQRISQDNNLSHDAASAVVQTFSRACLTPYCVEQRQIEIKHEGEIIPREHPRFGEKLPQVKAATFAIRHFCHHLNFAITRANTYMALVTRCLKPGCHRPSEMLVRALFKPFFDDTRTIIRPLNLLPVLAKMRRGKKQEMKQAISQQDLGVTVDTHIPYADQFLKQEQGREMDEDLLFTIPKAPRMISGIDKLSRYWMTPLTLAMSEMMHHYFNHGVNNVTWTSGESNITIGHQIHTAHLTHNAGCVACDFSQFDQTVAAPFFKVIGELLKHWIRCQNSEFWDKLCDQISKTHPWKGISDFFKAIMPHGQMSGHPGTSSFNTFIHMCVAKFVLDTHLGADNYKAFCNGDDSLILVNEDGLDNAKEKMQGIINGYQTFGFIAKVQPTETSIDVAWYCSCRIVPCQTNEGDPTFALIPDSYRLLCRLGRSMRPVTIASLRGDIIGRYATGCVDPVIKALCDYYWRIATNGKRVVDIEYSGYTAKVNRPDSFDGTLQSATRLVVNDETLHNCEVYYGDDFESVYNSTLDMLYANDPDSTTEYIQELRANRDLMLGPIHFDCEPGAPEDGAIMAAKLAHYYRDSEHTIASVMELHPYEASRVRAMDLDQYSHALVRIIDEGGIDDDMQEQLNREIEEDEKAEHLAETGDAAGLLV